MTSAVKSCGGDPFPYFRVGEQTLNVEMERPAYLQREKDMIKKKKKKSTQDISKTGE